VAMLLAVFGYLPALMGAIVQEVIDMLVIANALRALGPDWRESATPRLSGTRIDSLRQEHAELLPLLERLRTVAEGLDKTPPAQTREELSGLIKTLEQQLIPHEQADEASLYPRGPGPPSPRGWPRPCPATTRSQHCHTPIGKSSG